MPDYDLDRFVAAQDRVQEAVGQELRGGKKRSHWMWFVFPQIAGLGHSSTAQRYAIQSLEEARAYLAHPVLGRRLRDWTRLVLEVEGRSAEEIFGYPDYLKFRSSMTLFDEASDAETVFREALEKYYDGEPDRKTLGILGFAER
jgi:uncharacterized protein (DUF1810 family)